MDGENGANGGRFPNWRGERPRSLSGVSPKFPSMCMLKTAASAELRVLYAPYAAHDRQQDTNQNNIAWDRAARETRKWRKTT